VQSEGRLFEGRVQGDHNDAVVVILGLGNGQTEDVEFLLDLLGLLAVTASQPRLGNASEEIVDHCRLFGQFLR
jgi:hypothetical protein